jgi:hypothetical protein
MTRTTLSEPITIVECWKNRSSASIRVNLSTCNGRNIVDLRAWFTADGKLLPGKCFATAAKHPPRLAAALAKAEAKARELGLIPANNDNDDGGDE